VTPKDFKTEKEFTILAYQNMKWVVDGKHGPTYFQKLEGDVMPLDAGNTQSMSYAQNQNRLLSNLV